jgi:hypothetical protein
MSAELAEMKEPRALGSPLTFRAPTMNRPDDLITGSAESPYHASPAHQSQKYLMSATPHPTRSGILAASI